jgi:hypothetical protein
VPVGKYINIFQLDNRLPQIPIFQLKIIDGNPIPNYSQGMENETQKFLLTRKAQLEAELAIVNAGLAAAGVVVAQPIKKHAAVRVQSTSEPTNIPDQILAILAAHPQGLKREEIMEKVNAKYNRNISLIGCSSYLSTLKSDGQAKFDDEFLWTKK